MSTIKELSEFLYRERAKDLDPSALAEVFTQLMWCLKDNGAGIISMQYEWLKSNEVEKVKIALRMLEAFPFGSKSEMKSVLSRINTMWPELQEDAERFAKNWQHLGD